MSASDSIASSTRRAWPPRSRRFLVALLALGGAALAVVVVLGRGGLPSSAPTATAVDAGGQRPTRVELVASTGAGLGVGLLVQPVTAGENAVVVRTFDAAGDPSVAPPIRVAFSPLDHEAAGTTIEPQTGTNGQAVGEVDVTGDGWWRAEVTLEPPGGTAERVPYYLILPDPNVNGDTAAPDEGTDEAEAVFRQGLAGITSLHRVRYGERLNSGQGAMTQTRLAFSDGSDGRPPAFSLVAKGFEQVIVGRDDWRFRPATGWTHDGANPVRVPATWGEDYANASGFRLGLTEPVDGEPSQIVTFVVPPRDPDRGAAAHYAWWVGTESGRVRQEAMVSSGHYMLRRYGDFDAPFVIAPPPEALATSGSPVAGASPSASPVVTEP